MNGMIHILLPVYNRREITRRFIGCLKVQTYQHFHLVLIDDGSTDGTAEMVRENITNLTVITGKGNWWWAGSLQQGYQWLKKRNIPESDLVLIINDDVEFEDDFLEKTLTFLTNRKNTLLLARCYCRESGVLIDSGVHVDWAGFSFRQAITPSEINCLSTRGLFMRLSDFFKIGGFYPILLPHYTSDYEFTIRAHRKGFQLVSVTECWLKVDQKTTGFRNLSSYSLKFFWRKIFSNKSVENPLIWTAFILVSCPLKYKFMNILRVWLNFSALVYKANLPVKTNKRVLDK